MDGNLYFIVGGALSILSGIILLDLNPVWGALIMLAGGAMLSAGVLWTVRAYAEAIRRERRR